MKLICKFHKILKSPHPLDINILKNITGAITFGAFVFLFLIAFKPFGLQGLSGKYLITTTVGYGLVTTGYLIIHLLIIGSFLHENNWTFGKEIINTLIIIAMIGLCNYIYHSIYFSQTFIFIKLLGLQLETLAVSFLPVLLVTLLKQNILLKKYLHEAEEINRRKGGKSSINRDDKLVAISAQNPRNDFTCNCNDILFIHAYDNYVIIHFIKDSNYTKEIIRTTLKKTKENLNEYPNFYHCHKSYVVNLDKVINVSGNAQGLKLHFEYISEIIPVSRQLHQEFMHVYGMN
jgi:hypothetical protein